jgi:hypothetical protein
MAKRIIIAFVAGFIATLIFHQPVLALLHSLGITPRGAYAMKPVPPFGVPSVISLSFWGGVWGVIMMPVIIRWRGAAFWIGAILFGAILPTLVAAFVVAPLKHMPINGNPGKQLLIGLALNGAWGFGTALIYKVLHPR